MNCVYMYSRYIFSQLSVWSVFTEIYSLNHLIAKEYLVRLTAEVQIDQSLLEIDWCECINRNLYELYRNNKEKTIRARTHTIWPLVSVANFARPSYCAIGKLVIDIARHNPVSLRGRVAKYILLNFGKHPLPCVCYTPQTCWWILQSGLNFWKPTWWRKRKLNCIQLLLT